MASRCRWVSGSVIATACGPQPPAGSETRRASAASDMGSMVVPDLLATTYSVRARSPRIRRTAAGFTVSTITKRGNPGATPTT